jgi:hypothetical protein
VLSNHPANLILRFVLEIVALVAVGQWAWRVGESFGSALARIAFTIGLPLLMAALWAVFRAPDDPTQPEQKKPIVAISGPLRLLLEAVFFGFAVWTAFNMQRVGFGLVMVIALLLHYFWSAERVIRLIRQS